MRAEWNCVHFSTGSILKKRCFFTSFWAINSYDLCKKKHTHTINPDKIDFTSMIHASSWIFLYFVATPRTHNVWRISSIRFGDDSFSQCLSLTLSLRFSFFLFSKLHIENSHLTVVRSNDWINTKTKFSYTNMHAYIGTFRFFFFWSAA